jgi:ring-1,2-phenylacetyl-CoA epoxidase subunit PaaE
MDTAFYTLKVRQIVRETADAVTVSFDIPADLSEKFRYIAGQYLTFRTQINGEEVRRSYSLCTDPNTDAFPAVTVKQVEKGRMSTWFNTVLKEGDNIEAMPPMGKFTVTPEPGGNRSYVLFGGGSGITPLMGIAKTVLNGEPGSRIHLIYANRNPDSVIFKKQWADLESQFGANRLKVMLSYDQAPFTWFGLKGLLTEEKVMGILSSKIGGDSINREYFICGPAPMMDVVKNGLQKAGVELARIHTEYFSAPVGNGEATTTAVGTSETSEEAAAPFNGKAELTVTVYGKTTSFTTDDKTSILDAAIRNDLEPPYSCTVGVCTTCRAKVHKGKVEMKEREGLSDEEIEQGYVLTCQSYCRSSVVELSYE